MNALTVIEQTQLQDLEAVIEKGLQTFFDVGSALGEIRSQRLYRASHETFEEYCNERWGMSRSYASRVIGAADVVSNLLPIGNNGDPLPANESQARPLVGLEPEQQQEAWTTAVKATDGKPTAAAVKQAAEAIRNPEDVAYEWLKAYRDGFRAWSDLSENQTWHGSSPCWQAFERERPAIARQKEGKQYLRIARKRLLYERNLTITPGQVEGLVTRALNDFLPGEETEEECAECLKEWMEDPGMPPVLEARVEGISPEKVRAAMKACYKRLAPKEPEEASARERVSQALDDLWGPAGLRPAGWSASIVRRWIKDGPEDPTWHVLEARTNDLTSSEVQAALMAHLAATGNTAPQPKAIWELEQAVKAWMATDAPAGCGYKEPLDALQKIKDKATGWGVIWSSLKWQMDADEWQYTENNLRQAVNNVLDHHRNRQAAVDAVTPADLIKNCVDDIRRWCKQTGTPIFNVVHNSLRHIYNIDPDRRYGIDTINGAVEVLKREMTSETENRPINPYIHEERPFDPEPPRRCPRSSCRADFSRQPPEKIAVNHWRCPACFREMDSNGRVPAAAPIHEAEEPPVTQNEERENASHRELEELTREWLIKNHGSVPCDESWQTMSRIKERDGFDGFDRLYSYARTRTKLRIRPGDLWAVCLALYDYIQKDRNDGAVINYDQSEGEIANTEDLMAWSKSAGRWTCPKCKEESMFWTGEEGRCLECHFAYPLTIPAIDAGGETSPITPENIDEFDKILSNGGAVTFETPQEPNPSINSDGVYKIAVTKLVDYVRTWLQKERAGRWEVLDEITNGRGVGDEIEALRCWLPVATEHYYVADLIEACRIAAEEQRPEALTYLQTAERALSRAIVALDARTQREALLKTNSAYEILTQAIDMLKEKAP